MALNPQVFKTRTISAIVFAVVMLGGILLGFPTFFLLFTVIHFGCWYEFQKLVSKIYPPYQDISVFHRFGVMVAGWCLMLNFAPPGFQLFGMPLHEIGWWIGLTMCFVIPLTDLLLNGNINGKNIILSLGGLVYISLALSLLTGLYSHKISGAEIHPGYLIPLLIIGCIWINDTMAYICGSLFGKTPLSPVSPKKTREGTFGGIFLAVAVSSIVMYFIYPSVNTFFWIFLFFIIAIAGTFGDLLESKLKRMAGVKDSGRIMPGHGGFLDRFDSLLLAIPFVWIYLMLLNF